MEKSIFESDQSCTERCCEQISLLSKQKYELVTSANHIVLVGIEGPVGHWQTWKEAKSALESIMKIVERAYLELVLLGDSHSTNKKHLSKLEQELVDVKEELASVKIENDFMKRAVRYYTGAKS